MTLISLMSLLRPKAVIILMSSLWLGVEMSWVSLLWRYSPSRNILQSLQKWKDILQKPKLVHDACAPLEYGIGMKSTINPLTLGASHKIVGAGCAPSERNAFGDTPSEANVSINLNESLQMEAVATCLAPVENDSTIK
jgi:hypothetical protein